MTHSKRRAAEQATTRFWEEEGLERPPSRVFVEDSGQNAQNISALEILGDQTLRGYAGEDTLIAKIDRSLSSINGFLDRHRRRSW